MFSPFSKLIIRTPCYPIDYLIDLKSLLVTPAFQDGLFLASPVLWEQFKRYDNLSSKERDKVAISLTKYLLRACTRCTPFGSFAQMGFASIGDHNNLQIQKESVSKTRLDSVFLDSLIMAIAAQPDIQKQLKFFANNSIYKTPKDYRYFEYKIVKEKKTFGLCLLEATEYLTSTFEFAKNGTTLEALAKMIGECAEVTFEESHQFVADLISAQVLVHELEPIVTGLSPLRNLLQQLNTLKNTEKIVTLLEKIDLYLAESNNKRETCLSITEEVKKANLPVKIPACPLQVDTLINSTDLAINFKIIDSLSSQLNEIKGLFARYVNADLDDFKQRFVEKFEGAEIPLTIAVDTDFGVGYGSVTESVNANDLIDDLIISPNQHKNQSYHLPDFVRKCYSRFLRGNEGTIKLDAEENAIKIISNKSPNYPDSMYLMGSFYAQNNLFDEGNYLFSIEGFGGPSGANLFGRFIHYQEELLLFAKEILQKEEQSNDTAIFAEIVHRPQGISGNVITRPVLRSFEIPFVGKSGIEHSRQILISDLCVSIQNDEIILRSQSLNKRVIPRMTSAHNFKFDAIPIYKFLCDLQMQNKDYFEGWNWGALEVLDFLPRVSYKNIVLKRAQWRIHSADLQIQKSQVFNVATFSEIILEKYRLPKKVVIIDGENEMMLDFERLECIEIFLDKLTKNQNILLKEALLKKDTAVVSDKHGNSFANEVIIPLSYTRSNINSEYFPAFNNSVTRSFHIGSEWLYIKIYCSARMSDRVLLEIILPFVTQGAEQNAFEKFFFVRYKDSFPHLRVRFYSRENSKLALVEKRFLSQLNALMTDGLISNVQLESYNRELSRYDPRIIESVETLFYNDSICVLELLNVISTQKEQSIKLLIALVSVDQFLNDFGLSLIEKQKLLREMQSNFFNEFGGSLTLQKQLNQKYRSYQRDIFDIFDSVSDKDSYKNHVDQSLRKRSLKNKISVDDITKRNYASVYTSYLLSSFIHMSVNRFYESQQRKNELIIYHFLHKYYCSKMALGKKIS